MVESRQAEVAAKGGDGSGGATLEDLSRQIQAGQAKELRIILKADVSGSLGAITHALDQLNQDEIRMTVLREGAGDIPDNDIMIASASDAIIVGFNTKITETARRAAEAEGVDVRLYDIIYKLTDDISAALQGLLEPEVVEVVEGRAEVRQIFRVGKSTVIAGCYVTDGRIVRNGGARVWRGGKVIETDRIESLRRVRARVPEGAPNFCCGTRRARAEAVDGFNPPRAGPSAADPAHPRAPRPARRLGRAGDAAPAPPQRARGRRRPTGDRAVHGLAPDARPSPAPRGRHRRSGRSR